MTSKKSSLYIVLKSISFGNILYSFISILSQLLTKREIFESGEIYFSTYFSKNFGKCFSFFKSELSKKTFLTLKTHFSKSSLSYSVDKSGVKTINISYFLWK